MSTTYFFIGKFLLKTQLSPLNIGCFKLNKYCIFVVRQKYLMFVEDLVSVPFLVTFMYFK